MKVIFQPSSDSWQGSSFFWKVFSSKNHGHILFWKTPDFQYSHFFWTSSKLELDRPRPFQTGKTSTSPIKCDNHHHPPKKKGRKPNNFHHPNSQLRLSSCFGHLLLRQLGIFTGLQGLNGVFRASGMSFTPKTPPQINLVVGYVAVCKLRIIISTYNRFLGELIFGRNLSNHKWKPC